jgi:hypothetical protein
MSKTATKATIRALPALRTSLLWHKRETVRELRRRAEQVASPAVRRALQAKAAKVARMELADLRVSYQAERVAEIQRHRRGELARAVPGIVWLTA